ncbi:NAD(P)-dependent alcohol dehydrogenase [Chryseolinea sp. T2]|uniref:NAD(P)-dependent alcohol dehydrogenase n=1 Tax=Chryseolinea sp. T2 TaxID=3129255 RepID=UPI00307898A3
MKIKAYSVKGPGESPQPFTYEKRPGRNDVLVKISHCAIATGDVQMMNNAWGDSKYPLVPGHEIIGHVERAGANVSGLKAGDRIGIGYQLKACFECEYCKRGNEQFCPQQKVVGVDEYGGLADHMIVDHRFAFKLPARLDSALSAPLLSSGLTVYSAIVRADLPANSSTAVLGIGGLGHLAVQFLHKMGHEVSAFSHNAGKREMIESLGGKFLDSSNQTLFSSMNKKFDLILSTINANLDLNRYLPLLKPQGKFCFVAQPPAGVSLNAGLLYDYAQRTVYGNYTGSRKDMVSMLSFSAKHAVGAIVEVLSFSEMETAFERLKSGKIPMRLVLKNDD